MTKKQFQNLFDAVIRILKSRSPIDTGNLRYNAIKWRWIDDKTFEIYVDPKIAYYMVYTEEPWINHPGKNPNEGWFRDTVEFIVNYIAGQLKGKVVKTQ